MAYREADTEVEKRVLPTLYSDNYITLAPREQIPLTVSFDYTGPIVLVVKGWNHQELLCYLPKEAK